MIGRLVVLYNKINMKEFCSCCIFNQYLIFQVQIISRASRCKHASCHSWTLYQTCHFLVCWPVTVPHNISSALMIIRNAFLAWYAIECMFILVCWSIWELSCPQFLILAFIWLLLQLLWLWRPRLLMIFCPRVIRWFRKRKRQNNMLHCHLVSLFDLWGWFIEATLQNTRNLCIISCKFGPVVLVGEWYKLFIFWMVRERERAGGKEAVWVINCETCLLVWEMFEASNLIESDEKAWVSCQMREYWTLMFILCYSF